MIDQPEDLLPHRDSMALLSRVVFATRKEAAAVVEISDESAFFSSPKGVPGWIAIEYMAQTIGLIAGMEGRALGTGIPVGYLLGTRKLTCEHGAFSAGSELLIAAQEALVDDNGLAAYNCQISMEGRQIAESRLTVFREPANS